MRPIIGVDQTGAIDANGRPKKLPVAILVREQLEFAYIDSFNAASIARLFGGSLPKDLKVALDCVLGLPEVLNISLKVAMQQTLDTPGFGRKAASAFFSALGQGKIHSRNIELLARANSVFRERPFQKNIQTGTFRFWKDLAQNPGWYYFPHVEKKMRGLIPIYECYPSHSWRSILGAPTREPLALDRWMKKAKIQVKLPRGWKAQVERDSNLADSAVIALHLAQLAAKDLLREPHPEGWILGF